MSTDVDKVEALAIVVGLAVAGYLVYRLVKLGPGGVVKAAGAAANAAASTAVGAAGAVVGLPTPDETETDPAVARYLIDELGYFTASQWTSAGALFSGALLSSGTGTPPAAGRPVWSVLQADAKQQLQTQPIDYGSGGNDWSTASQGLPDVGSLDPGADYVSPATGLF